MPPMVSPYLSRALDGMNPYPASDSYVNCFPSHFVWFTTGETPLEIEAAEHDATARRAERQDERSMANM